MDGINKKWKRDYKEYPGKLDHTTCISITIGTPPKHPFTSLGEVVKSQYALNQFSSYLFHLDHNLSAHYPGLTVDHIKLAMQNDLQFYNAFQSLDQSNLTPENMKLALNLLERFVIYSNNDINKGIFLTKQSADQIHPNILSALTPAILEVNNRIEFLFKMFKTSDFMLYGCFDS